jgi:hypothetical protein
MFALENVRLLKIFNIENLKFERKNNFWKKNYKKLFNLEKWSSLKNVLILEILRFKYFKFSKIWSILKNIEIQKMFTFLKIKFKSCSNLKYSNLKMFKFKNVQNFKIVQILEMFRF